MPTWRTRRRLSPLLAMLLLAACESEAANLAEQVVDARGDCDQANLRASTEECVQMFQRYAEMGTEAIHTYIGAMKAFDQALQRMPPAEFDTVGLGRAVTRATGEPAATSGLAPSGPSYYYGAYANPAPDFDEEPRGAYPYGDSGGGRDSFRPGGHPGSRYPADPYGDGYDRRQPAQPGWYGQREDTRRDPRGGMDPRYADPRYADPRYADPRYADPRGYAGPGNRSDPRYGEDRSAYRPLAPRSAPGPGLLLPPEERLRRPWLYDDEYLENERYPDPRYGPSGAYPPDDWYEEPLPVRSRGSTRFR